MKFFKKRKTVPMTPIIPKPVEVITSPGSKYQQEKEMPKKVVKVEEQDPIVNMATEKVTTKTGEEYDFSTLEKFKEETGKRALYAGKPTKAFKEWLEQKHA